MIYASITGTGSYLPGQPVSNTALIEKGVDSDDDWISSRTGILSRHFATPDDTASEMGAKAAKKALEKADVSAEALDLIIVATSTPDCIFPSTACLLQAKIGNHGASAFDVQAVCSGFIYALATADKFIRAGGHKKALVVGTEVFSRLMDWQDRSTCVLFGDGAAAIVLEAGEMPGILASALHADGRLSNILNVKGQVANGKITGDPFLRMDGQAVFKTAVRVLSEVAEEVVFAAGLTMDAIDWLIPHQANVRIIDMVAKKAGIPRDRVIVTLDCHGNTSAASVPLALDAAVQDGRIQKGHTVLLEGVGGGFTWGAVLLRF